MARISVEQFVLAKYYMNVQVYYHKIRLITDGMIGRGISLGIKEDKIQWLKDLYAYDGSDAHLQEYLRWSDEKLILEILSERTADGYAKRIFRNLTDRVLPKCIFSAKEKEFENVAPEIRHLLFTKPNDICVDLEKMVAKTYGFDAEFVMAKIVRFKPATQTESEIMVLRPSRPTPFREESTLFSSVNEAIKEQRIDVYAPAIYEEREKKRQQRDFQNEIFHMILELSNPQGSLPIQ